MISKHVKFRIETAGGSLAKYLRKVLFEPSTVLLVKKIRIRNGNIIKIFYYELSRHMFAKMFLNA
jgi:hypothetical protein